MPTNPTRRERERLARRSEMLSAARSVFAEKGYSRSTVDEIAQRSEFGKGTLYNYFEGGKEEILIAVLNQLYEGIAEICGAVFSPEKLESEPIRSLFREFLVQIFDHFTEHRDVFIINLKEAHGMLFAENNKLASAVAARREQVVGLLKSPLQYGMDTGQLRQLPAESVAHLLFGNIKGMQMQRCLFSMHLGSTTSCAESSGQPNGEHAQDDASHRTTELTYNTSAEQADFLISVLFDGLLSSTTRIDEESIAP